MAHKRNESESSTGYTGKYFRYDQSSQEKNHVLDEKRKEKNVAQGKQEKPRKKKK